MSWDVAFVDFNLSSRTSTGLTALLRLHHERPDTKIVTYSQFTESGRTLYAAAGRHWFGAAALLDKVKNDPTTLVRYRESIHAGINPTPVMWQRRLHWAHLIDNLLADPAWVRIWRALRDAAGRHGGGGGDPARGAGQPARLQGPGHRGGDPVQREVPRHPAAGRGPGTRRASWPPSPPSTGTS